MIVLAIDTSTAACSAALCRDSTVLARRFQPQARGQSETILPMVAEIMAEAGVGFADLGLLAVTVGPGAFTGLRIGLAAARGLALATGLPLAGIPTPLAIAAAIPPGEREGRTLLVVVDSRREEPWVQAFTADLTPLSEPVAVRPALVPGLVCGPVVVAGDGAGPLMLLLDQAVAASSAPWPDAAVVAGLAARMWPRGEALPPEPLYLRAPDVTCP